MIKLAIGESRERGSGMLSETDFQIDQRVAIAMDALEPDQKASLNSALRSKANFIAQASSPGRSERLSNSKDVYVLRVENGLRVFDSKSGDKIVILDVMRKATMDRLMTKKKRKKKAKGSSSRTSPGGVACQFRRPLESKSVRGDDGLFYNAFPQQEAGQG